MSVMLLSCLGQCRVASHVSICHGPDSTGRVGLGKGMIRARKDTKSTHLDSKLSVLLLPLSYLLPYDGPAAAADVAMQVREFRCGT